MPKKEKHSKPVIEPGLYDIRVQEKKEHKFNTGLMQFKKKVKPMENENKKNIELLKLFEKIVSEKTKYKSMGNAKYHISEIKSGADKGALLILFPQTQNVTGWIKNFSAFARMYKKTHKSFLGFIGKLFFVHAGFKDLWNDLESSLKKDIEKYFVKKINKDEKAVFENHIIISGYSQGGALATIAYDKLVNAGYNVAAITFGAPRTFIMPPLTTRKRFVNLHRFYVRGDIVTRVPFFPFWHVGKGHGMGKRCFFSNAVNHTITAYKNNIKEWVSKK